jgi:hypothetical protein
MRVQIFALVVALSLGMGICRAQSAESKPVEPVAVGQIFLLDSSSQTLKMLPVEGTKEVTHALGGGWSPYYLAGLEIKGTSSPFRIGSGTKIELVFKTGNPESVVLYSTEQVKKNRRAYYARNRGRELVSRIPGIPILVTQYGQSSYKLTTNAPLPPGEYLISLGTNANIITFGVDQ